MARTAIDASDATLDEPLPDALGENLRTLFDREERPETVGDWVQTISESVRAELGRPIATDDLCHVDDGEHVTRVLDDDGDVVDVNHFACFYDGLVLAGMTDAAVGVETVCPETDETIRFEGTLDDLASDAAVVSIGVANDPLAGVDGDGGAGGDGGGEDADDAPPSFSHVYGATCPYVKAFASREAYEAWREDVDAATLGLSPDVALAAARELAE